MLIKFSCFEFLNLDFYLLCIEFRVPYVVRTSLKKRYKNKHSLIDNFLFFSKEV